MKWFLQKLRRARSLWRPLLELLKHVGKRRVVVELPMAGELPYLLPILAGANELPKCRLILMPRSEQDLTHPQVRDLLKPISKNFLVMSCQDIQSLARWIRFHGWITSEQFSEPLLRPAICIFHGQPSKGQTFNEQVLKRFDHFFHLGPLHRRALDEFVDSSRIDPANLPVLHNIGYPKTDRVIREINSKTKRTARKPATTRPKAILYAPAFNEYCTLRTIGCDLIRTLAALPDTRVTVKLAPDSIGPTNSTYATGGVNWRRRIESLGLSNVTVVTDLDCTNSILDAEVMVTDVSGVGYECLAVGRPVIYFECLEFYEKTVLPNNPKLTLNDLIDRDTMNGGRNFGTVVRSLEELTDALSEPVSAPDAVQMQSLLLYNPGTATDAALQTIKRLLT